MVLIVRNQPQTRIVKRDSRSVSREGEKMVSRLSLNGPSSGETLILFQGRG